MINLEFYSKVNPTTTFVIFIAPTCNKYSMVQFFNKFWAILVSACWD